MTGAAALLLGLAACGVVGTACSLGLAGRLVLMVKGYSVQVGRIIVGTSVLYIYAPVRCYPPHTHTHTAAPCLACTFALTDIL